MRKPNKTILLFMIFGVLPLIALYVFYEWRFTKVYRDLHVNIGDQTAHVKIVISSKMNVVTSHGLFIAGRDLVHITYIEFADGKRINFTTDEHPDAIWMIRGRLFTVWPIGHCEWFIGEWRDGQWQRIPLKQLPPGDHPWNLVDEEYRNEVDADFKQWAQ